ncbi:MAG: 50S ribosomal protein L22 [Candidatus Coatesbacteria bacterium 4484_99]|uniref:Large ribosomal subunit protein uL22 n=1 Tax=Candidatus Coatesbacteria bacterium 4484_99 TaxID=1970774 RepID=A0A1W9S0T6_9BACT|nr:MAG: 50S ribosomal protein L22 [Candidatus Coatesbacteria bacterium 4484_99]RLC40402.1 MAG: 50S ribosomal protein L22 [Candidatus Coatesbacteria bacterium]RLC41959.1 MAG: 50S ribosomal protein L22 [Candidatus Coatesbacteria bacterium]RLC44710.1 MAG: 50S ribosomal protein L22 [Candidatus Coatesbacteria bacterium]
MELRATSKYILISPRKARQVANLVRGKRVDEALDILRFVHKRASYHIEKTIISCVSNAENIIDKKERPDVDRLYIKRIFVNEGPRYKRIFYRAYGRASMKLRRMSHIEVVLDESDEGKKSGPEMVRKERLKKKFKTRDVAKKKSEKKEGKKGKKTRTEEAERR